MVLNCESEELGISGAVREQVRQTVGPSRDRILGSLKRQDMHNGQLAPPMRCLDHCLQSFFVQRRDPQAILAAVVINDLADEVIPFGNSRIDEVLRFLRRRDGVNWNAVFGAMPIGSSRVYL